jgi:hypothetical protein
LTGAKRKERDSYKTKQAVVNGCPIKGKKYDKLRYEPAGRWLGGFFVDRAGVNTVLPGRGLFLTGITTHSPNSKLEANSRMLKKIILG